MPESQPKLSHAEEVHFRSILDLLASPKNRDNPERRLVYRLGVVHYQQKLGKLSPKEADLARQFIFDTEVYRDRETVKKYRYLSPEELVKRIVPFTTHPYQPLQQAS